MCGESNTMDSGHHISTGMAGCADELEAALAAYKWTKITEEIARDISYRNIKWLVWSKDYGHEVLDGAVLMARLGDSFRPFLSLDTPPQESE